MSEDWTGLYEPDAIRRLYRMLRDEYGEQKSEYKSDPPWHSYPSSYLDREQSFSEHPEDRFAKREYERLWARHRLLLSLLGQPLITERIKESFSEDCSRANWRLGFETIGTASAADYATLFGALDSLNRLFLSLVRQDYFLARWLRGEQFTFESLDVITIERITKNSPGEVLGSAVGEVAKALGQVLSIGNQVRDYKLAKVQVEEAELALEKKRILLEEDKLQATLREGLLDLDAELARERKLLELEQLRVLRDEAVRNRRKLALEDLNQRFDILSKGIKVLNGMPKELQEEIKGAVFSELEAIRSTRLIVTKMDVLETREHAEEV